MSQPSAFPPHLQKALVFFQQPVWARVIEALYKKYIEQGRIGGQVVLERCTPEELREIARFLSRPLPASTDLSIRLTDFQQALTSSGFACELPQLLQAIFPERSHVTRPEQKERRMRSQRQFDDQLSALSESIPASSRGRSWLMHGKHGRDALFRQYKNESQTTQQYLLQALQLVLHALDHLPAPPAFQSLSHFALHISGDPHFFDATTTGGRLFLAALMDLAEMEQSATAMPFAEQDHWRHLLYYEAGLLLDTISSTVVVFHLKSAQDLDGQVDALITHAGERVLVLPLRQLLAWQALRPVSQHIYVVENPQVFAVMVDALLQAASPTERALLPTLICTSGWPSVAAIRFLSLLTQSTPDVHLHYSGDFDLPGLQIASYLLYSYPYNYHLWRFDPASYQVALHDRTVEMEANELTLLSRLPAAFTPLIQTMQQERKKAYQEGITQLLVEDIRSAINGP